MRSFSPVLSLNGVHDACPHKVAAIQRMLGSSLLESSPESPGMKMIAQVLSA
jgi:hypothetical protein